MSGVRNSSPNAKATLREWLLSSLGEKGRVLDCFAGTGVMRRACYLACETYVGIDEKAVDPLGLNIVCDSRRYLRHRDLDLARFNLFDLDAFGTPYEHMAIICSRLRLPKGQLCGFALTDGCGFNAAMNGTNGGLMAYVGLLKVAKSREQLLLRNDIATAAIRKALKTAKLELLEARRAEKATTGAQVRYSALLCEAL